MNGRPRTAREAAAQPDAPPAHCGAASASRTLALFDLDHTLLPFDSGMRWADFLVARGAVAADFATRYLAACQDYVDGRRDVVALHRLAATAFAACAETQIAELGTAFGAFIQAQVPAAAHALVDRHRRAGALCCIVSATNRPVVEVFARLLGIGEVCATELEVRDGRYSGQLAGAVCHGAEKPRRVHAWLQARGQRWTDFADSVFYTDSCSDLPLLERCSRPVAVSPDARLRAHALAAGWPVADTLADTLAWPSPHD